MDIKETFLKLTSQTYPYGQEDEVVKFLPEGKTEIDSFGNYFVRVGESKTAFSCHLDTVSSKQVKVTHVVEDNIIKTDGTSILGADDKAGVTVLLWMIEHGIPGTYYFFIGEEVGCIGSGNASKHNVEIFKQYDRMVAFDRRDTCSVITFQSGQRCCSDEFGQKLASELNEGGLELKLDKFGVYTDSAEFTSIIPECTNISVGYYSEHTTSERQDIEYLIKLCHACLNVKWDELPTARDKSKVETRWSSSYDTSRRDPMGYDDYVTNRGTRNSRVWPQDNRNSKHYDRCFYDEYGDYSDESTGYYEARPKDSNAFRLSEDDRRALNGDNRENWDDFTARTRRSGKKNKKKRAYFDSLENEILVDGEGLVVPQIRTNVYAIYHSKYLSDKITEKELDIITSQYLDINNPDDLDVYHYLYDDIHRVY